MLATLWVFVAAVEPGTGLDLPAKDDPVGRLIVGLAIVLTPMVPWLVAKAGARKQSSNGPGAPVATSATPTLDTGSRYIQEYIDSLKTQIEQNKIEAESRISAVEAKNELLIRQVREALEDRAVFKTQVEGLTADVAELRADNVELRAENRALRSRLNA